MSRKNLGVDKHEPKYSMGRGGVPIARARLEWQFEHGTPFLIRNNNGPPVRHAPVGIALGQDFL